MKGIFLKHYWVTMKFDVMHFFTKFKENEADLRELNYTYIAIIPKIVHIVHMKDLDQLVCVIFYISFYLKFCVID